MNPKIDEILKALRFEASIYVGSSTSLACEVAADIIEQLQYELVDERYRHDRLQDFCVAQGEELSRLKAQQRWIPVTERLPEDRETVLTICVTRREGSKKFHRVNFYDAIMGEWMLTAPLHKVTHWMPLPELPKEE